MEKKHTDQEDGELDGTGFSTVLLPGFIGFKNHRVTWRIERTLQIDGYSSEP